MSTTPQRWTLWCANMKWLRQLAARVSRRLRSVVGPVRVQEGEIPPWWMGVAYHDWCMMRLTMYAVPLHHLVSAAWRLNAAWCRYRGRRSWIDHQIECALRANTEADRT